LTAIYSIVKQLDETVQQQYNSFM